MSDEIFFDGRKYISASDAALLADLSHDYVARLAREGVIAGRRVGKNWYVDRSSLNDFVLRSQYTKGVRKEIVSEKRLREYGNPVREQLASGAGALLASDTVRKAKSMLHAPTGMSDAAMNAMHTPLAAQASHLVSPAVELVHKLVALTLALSLTFGTYALVDPQYAKFALGQMQDAVSAAKTTASEIAVAAKTGELPHDSTILGIGSKARLALSSVASAGVGGVFENIARAFSSGVDGLVYAIAFPLSLVSSNGIAGAGTRGKVTVQIVNGQKQENSNKKNNPRNGVATTVINNLVYPERVERVVERIVNTERIVAQGGITQAQLDSRLAEIQKDVTARITNLQSANSTQAVNIYQSISNPGYASSGSSGVSNASQLTGTLGIAHGGTGQTAAPAYGELLVGDGTGGFALVATTSLGISGSGSSFAYLFPSNATSTLIAFNGGASTTLLSALDTLYIGRTATTTIRGDGMASILPYASTTAITATTASSTNLVVSGAGGSAGCATFSATGILSNTGTACGSGSGSSFGKSWEVAFGALAPTTTLGILVSASSTIGNGTQAGGLTISGGATTTGNLFVQGGKIGIGTPAAGFNAPLSFGANLGDNIYLYDAGVGSSYGIGIQNLSYRFFTDGSGADIAFGYGGSSGSAYFNPNVTLKGNGFSGFGTTSPYAKLTAWGTGQLFEAVNNSSTTIFKIGQSGATTTNLYTDSLRSTSATTTNLAITGIASSLLKTDASGNVAAAVAGTDYLTSANLFGKSWEVSGGFLAPTTTLYVTNIQQASSTVFSANYAKIGGSASTTIDSSGNVAVAGTLDVTGKTTFGNASTTNVSAGYASSTNLFAGSATIGSLSGFVKATAGLLATALVNLASDITGILPVANGGTGWAAVASGAVPYGNGGSALATTTAGTGGYVLAYLNGVPTWAATTTLSTISGTLATTQGGTGVTSYATGDILYSDSSNHLTTLTVGGSGTVLKVAGGVPTWGTDLTSGGGGGAGAWATTSDSLAVYPTDTTDVIIVGSSATATLTSIFEVSGKSYFSNTIGIATTTPGTIFSIGNVANFAAGGSTLYSALTLGTLTATSTLTVSGNTTLANATTSNLFSFNHTAGAARFGATATSSFDSAGALTLASALTVGNGGTGATSLSGGQVLFGNGTGVIGSVATGTVSSSGGITTTAGRFAL
ncbi:hypothetical protein HY968_00005, partial [Candidatus Kaiserbacteria bacterium]|nr:hypothetical protein [Candidatus Kaiserbacteria bacterium]